MPKAIAGDVIEANFRHQVAASSFRLSEGAAQRTAFQCFATQSLTESAFAICR